MDALSAVLAPVRLYRTAWASTLARGAWGIDLPVAKRCIRFHYVIRGSAWLRVEKTNEPPVALAGGDLAVIALGHAHSLRDQPRSATQSFGDLVGAKGNTPSTVVRIALGTAGRETELISGAFELDDPMATPIVATLPPLLRMTPATEHADPSFADSIQLITRELDRKRPGSEIVLLRMTDVLFIQILRAYLARKPDSAAGFLGALRDESTAAALAAMHRRPEDPWTVAALAEEVGLSRSVFAARFARLVGEPPLSYLTRLRMQKAAALLRNGATLAKATRLTGYASKASFSHAFRQWAGVAPGAWRESAPANAT